MTKECLICNIFFKISDEDIIFYERIKVPIPTLCSDCRQQRRYAWRNERTLYRRACDLCGKSTVTIYSPNKPLKVYCLKCWWGDGWDTSIYGRDFDFSRSFFEQYYELQNEVPRMALLSKNSVNSDYTNHSGDIKNTYLSFCCFNTEDVSYSTWVIKSRNCIDCSYIFDSGEKLYECIDSRKSYGCQYSVLLENCVSCYYSYDLHNCNNCFLSSNLRNKNYVFKNKQYEREEYIKKVSEYNLGSHKVRINLYDEFINLMMNDSIHRYVISERNINCTGNMVFNSKNSKNCFDAETLEDTKNIYASLSLKNSMDLYHVGWGTELSYELHGCRGLYNSKFCHLCYDNRDIMYSDSCQNCQNLFGCISVKKGEYMILNKKYKKEEYEVLKNKIIEHMKNTGEYGEFFSPSISPVCYNETQGNFYMPLTKEEVFSHGWKWEEKVPGIFGKETISINNIPDDIASVDESILKEIFICSECNKNFNLTKDEFSFYKVENIPLPHFCPSCRYMKRFNIRLPRKLWSGVCKCDRVGHGHDGKCEIKFKTSYNPERKELVYCEDCYNKEIY
jgi:hypothetical protein